MQMNNIVFVSLFVHAVCFCDKVCVCVCV
jgi:hypothetical protein